MGFVQFSMFNILVLEMSFNYLVIATWSLNIIIVLLQLRRYTNNEKIYRNIIIVSLRIQTSYVLYVTRDKNKDKSRDSNKQ